MMKQMNYHIYLLTIMIQMAFMKNVLLKKALKIVKQEARKQEVYL